MFWAEAEDQQAATDAEDIFAALAADVDESAASEKVRAILQNIHDGTVTLTGNLQTK